MTVTVGYTPLYTWTEIVLNETWGIHAKAYRADDTARAAPSAVPEQGTAQGGGCYHALVLEPDPLRNRPMYQLQVERYSYFWNDGVRTNTPDVLAPGLLVLLDAKMQLVPSDVLMAVLVEDAAIKMTPVHVVQAMQVGRVGSMLDRMGGKQLPDSRGPS